MDDLPKAVIAHRWAIENTCCTIDCASNLLGVCYDWTGTEDCKSKLGYDSCSELRKVIRVQKELINRLGE